MKYPIATVLLSMTNLNRTFRKGSKINHPLQINLKPRFTERKGREDESKKSWRLICVRSKKIFAG